MKRFTMIVALAMMMVMPAFAERVTPETARKVATTFMLRYGVKAELRLIDYADQEAFPNFYVFGTENSFIIISADDCIQPVLGYSTENPFGTEKMSESVFWWLKAYDEQIADAAKNGQKATDDVKQQWEDLASGIIPVTKNNPTHLIQTEWNQKSPYNDLCPSNKQTGCVATAMAQIMKYWEYPTTGFGTHSYTPFTHPDYGVLSVNFGETTYDWNNMTNTYDNSSGDIEKAAVATLMYHCGVSLNTDYGYNKEESAATTSHVIDALKNYFNYCPTAQYITRTSVNNDEEWKNILITELCANPPRPIQYRGSNGGVGHSFICDGYDESNGKFHFNFGGDSSSNGWFEITGIGYSQGHAAIIGIKPITYNVQPSNFGASVSGRDVNLTWNTVESAVSYNIYRDYNLIDNTTSLSFFDANVTIGEHMYFIRCVDSEGNVSLPSDIASVTVEFNNTLAELTVEHLQVAYDNNTATLQWENPYRLNYLDYYSFEGNKYYSGPGAAETFYWGTRFPASMLSSSTSLTSVSTYFYTSGQYSTFVYQCLDGIPSGNPVATVTGTYPKGWNNIALTSSLSLDDQQDLWIIFKSTDIEWPIILGEQNADDGNYYSTNGTNWKHRSGYSFFISANLSNGNFTYTLYDNGGNVASNLIAPIHTLSPSSNAVHQYTVKTNYYGEETNASNMVGYALGSASITSLSLGDNDKMTLTEGSTLTVSGTLTNSNPKHLVLEDGAQLIHNSNDVTATVKKNIGAWTTEKPVGGWYFIASPIDSTELDPTYVVNMLTDANEENGPRTYDLYSYDGETPWVNYRAHSNNFVIENGKGYLYANASNKTLEFRGGIKPCSNSTSTVTLTNNGWNLFGNPFTCAVTVSKPFSELNNGSSVTNKGMGSTINPCAGIAVYGNIGEEVTFTAVEPQESTPSPRNLNITLAQQISTRNDSNAPTIDNAIVSFNESEHLPKFTLLEANSKLYIPQDNEEYAIVSAEARGELPLNFHANENGQYTLSVNPENVEMEYLHLIDNLTGNNIDLLTTPSYTFEAKTSDYASRFKLVFASVSEDADGDNENFAFINNGNIMIYKEGTIQIVDMMGHVVYQRETKNHISTSGMASGMYILRLITTDGMKTQKMIIE